MTNSECHSDAAAIADAPKRLTRMMPQNGCHRHLGLAQQADGVCLVRAQPEVQDRVGAGVEQAVARRPYRD